MRLVTISIKYQVVIPKNVRKALLLSPGDKLQVYCYQNRAVFARVNDAKKMRGSLKGIDTTIIREKYS